MGGEGGGAAEIRLEVTWNMEYLSMENIFLCFREEWRGAQIVRNCFVAIVDFWL